GRHAGWITLHAGLAANANAIVLPEFELDITALVAFLEHRLSTRGSAIIAVSEGLDLGSSQQQVGVKASEVRLHGAAESLMEMIEAARPGRFEMRSTVLGHTQRGGSPVAADRLLAKRFGVAAM